MTTPPQPPPLVVEPADPFRYSLRREPGGWVLVFQNGGAKLKYEIGLAYVGYLLSHPDKHVPSATLFSEFSTGHRKDLPAPELPDPESGELIPLTDAVGIGHLPPQEEEEEARSAHYAKLREYKESLDDLTIPESERAEAQQRHDELLVFLKEHYHRTHAPGQAVTKLVYKSIQRLCHHLREAMPGEKAPSPVSLAFAEYIAGHILLPSRRYTRARPGANIRIARGGLAGRLIFECPPDHRWSVHM